jgi:hypothetical protein
MQSEDGFGSGLGNGNKVDGPASLGPGIASERGSDLASNFLSNGSSFLRGERSSGASSILTQRSIGSDLTSARESAVARAGMSF